MRDLTLDFEEFLTRYQRWLFTYPLNAFSHCLDQLSNELDFFQYHPQELELSKASKKVGDILNLNRQKIDSLLKLHLHEDGPTKLWGLYFSSYLREKSGKQRLEVSLTLGAENLDSQSDLFDSMAVVEGLLDTFVSVDKLNSSCQVAIELDLLKGEVHFFEKSGDDIWSEMISTFPLIREDLLIKVVSTTYGNMVEWKFSQIENESSTGVSGELKRHISSLSDEE